MYIVESPSELSLLLSYITTDQLVVDVTCIDAEKHAMNNGVSLLFFYFLSSKTYWCLPVRHNEALILSDGFTKVKEALKLSIHKKYVMDKKSMLQLIGYDFDFTDANLLRYLNDGTIDEKEYKTNAHEFVAINFRNIPDTNACVPLYKHARAFMDKIEMFNIQDLSGSNETGFAFTNDIMTNCFAKLEANGLYVNDDFTDEFGNEQTKHIKNNLVFTQYNFLTSTGRPSNRFGGVNYAALKKDDGSRNCFVSRHGKDGMLVMMDYSAFHPRLIAHLANFSMGVRDNPYTYLAKYYFDKKESDVNEEDIAVSKAFTFTQIYGGFDKKWLHIPYFGKIQEYIDHRWRFFEENGYIETPKYKRKIKRCHIQDPNPSKLFNYILQAFETEMAVDVLGEILVYLKGRLTVPILYTYDSILFDVHKADKMETIKRLKSIMEHDKFPVKVSAGKNYKEMKNIAIP